jgi:hypothetical protein
MTSTTRATTLGRAAALGAVSGVVGASVMAVGEKLEQAVTHRPDSYVPARALLATLGRRTPDDAKPTGWNFAMHYATGAAVGSLRGVWAALGMRGPRADLAHAAVRLATDQTIENVTAVGAPPHTWPALDQAVDFLHKGVYSFVTGLVADRLIAPTLEQRRGRTSH